MKNKAIEFQSDSLPINTNARMLFVVDEPRNKAGIQFMMIKNLCRKIGINMQDIQWTDLTSPTLNDELDCFWLIVPIGRQAIKRFIGEFANVKHYRGRPVELNGKTYFPIQSVSESITREEQMEILKNDLLRINLWSLNGGNKWFEPTIVVKPSMFELRNYLAQKDMHWSFDLEVNGIDPFKCKIRCLALGNHRMVIVLPLLSVDGRTRFYDPIEQIELNGILIEFFGNSNIVQTGHNSIMFDSIVLKQQLGVHVIGGFDTLIAHSMVQPNMPHDLGFCASYYTFAPNWKTERKLVLKGDERETDDELHRYCAYDVAITSLLLDKMMTSIQMDNLQLCVRFYMSLQVDLAKIHYNGLNVDQKTFHRLVYGVGETLSLIREVIANKSCVTKFFNPSSNVDLNALLFGEWELEPNMHVKMKTVGEELYSITDDVLKGLITSRGITDSQIEIIEDIRRYRKIKHFQSNQLKVLKNTDENGRIHPTLNVHSSPNNAMSHGLSKFPKFTLTCIQPKVGRSFVLVKVRNLEYYFIAQFLGCRELESMIRTERNVEVAVTKKVMGGKKNGLPGSRLRVLVRHVFRSVVYEYTIEQTHKLLLSIENNEDQLMFPDISLKEVRVLYTKVKGLFRISKRNKFKAEYEENQYIVDPILKKRIVFSDNIIKDLVETTCNGFFNFILARLMMIVVSAEKDVEIVYATGRSIVIECNNNEIDSVKRMNQNLLSSTIEILNTDASFITTRQIETLGEI